MFTSYCIMHTDGLVMRFADYETAAAWADAQPVNSMLAELFLAFIVSPSDDGAVAASTADVRVRMYGGWTFTETFNPDNPNSQAVDSLSAALDARAEVERLTALLNEARATALYYLGQAYTNGGYAAILRILDA